MAQAELSSIHAEQLIDLLRELALDLGAVWKRHSDEIWRQIDPEVWLNTRNPWLVLQQASENRVRSMASDQHLRRRVEQLVLARPRMAVSPQDVEAAKMIFDPNALTLGFARRFAT
jgi:glycogen phosphorylase